MKLRTLFPLLAVLVASPSLPSAEADPLTASRPPENGHALLKARVVDATTGTPIACSVAIVDPHGRTILDGEGYRDGFRSTGEFDRSVPAGHTKIRITRGLEYKAWNQEFDLRAGELRVVEVKLERRVDLRSRGWFAGDSHVHMLHGERRIPVDFDQVALAARAEDLQYLSLGQSWTLDKPTPEALEAELTRRSRPDCALTWGLEAPKNYYRGDAGRCLGHCWNLGMRGRTDDGHDVIATLLEASAWDYESEKPSYANFESHALIHAQGGAVCYTHPARWWMGPWGGNGGYPKREQMRVSNMAVELPLDVLVGPTFDGMDVITGAGEPDADEKAFALWALLLNHGYRLAATASSDACFDRPGGGVPGAARLYTFSDGGVSIVDAKRAVKLGRTFATTGPLLVVTADDRPPGSSFEANGHAVIMRIEAWSSGASTGGLARVEILRNGESLRRWLPTGESVAFQTNVIIAEKTNAWYCVRAFGPDESRQRAVSGAFFFETKPWRSPEPVPANIQIRVVEAGSGRPLDATVTELSYEGTRPKPGRQHRVEQGSGRLTVPGTVRLKAEAAGFEPQILSPFLDHTPLVELITRMDDKDLLDWRTFERIRALLNEAALSFRLTPRQSR